MKRKNVKVPFYKKYRILSLTIFMFLIIIPLILIPSVYISNAIKSKDILFDNPSLKVTPKNKNDKFEVTAELVEKYLDNDNEGYFKEFEFKITLSTTATNISNFNIQTQLSVKNDKYDSFTTSRSISNNSTLTIRVPFAYNMNKRILPFMKPKVPTLYVKISYSYTDTQLADPEPIIVKVNYKYS